MLCVRPPVNELIVKVGGRELRANAAGPISCAPAGAARRACSTRTPSATRSPSRSGIAPPSRSRAASPPSACRGSRPSAAARRSSAPSTSLRVYCTQEYKYNIHPHLHSQVLVEERWAALRASDDRARAGRASFGGQRVQVQVRQ